MANKKTSDVECRLRDLINIKLEPDQNPIVFSNDYDITFAGIEKWYPLDTCKGGNVFRSIKGLGLISDADVVKPQEATFCHLLLVHNKTFLENINLVHIIEGLFNQSRDVKQGAGTFPDIPSLALLPSFIVNNKLLRPFRFQVGGSVLAAKLALDIGWSINLGGGFTHCHARRSGCFSPYSDVALAVNFLLEKVERIMIIDLSAQQCNGPERSFMHNDRVHILDVYNRDIYPLDGFARRGISIRGELENHCCSKAYLDTIRIKLENSLDCFKPDFVLYVAGMDVVVGDAAGCMSVSGEAVVERDQLVFLKIRSRGIPISMFLGGGFSRCAHGVIARSVVNLHNFGLITVSRSSRPAKSLVEKNDLTKTSSYSTGDLRLADGSLTDGEGNCEITKESENSKSEFQTVGFIHKSKTFMGSLISWASWSKPQSQMYHSLSHSDSLEDVNSDGSN